MGMTRTKRIQREARRMASAPARGSLKEAFGKGSPSPHEARPLGLTITLGLATLPPTLTVTLDNGGELSLPIEGETGLALAELLRRQGARRGTPEGSALPRISPRLLQPDAMPPARRYNQKGRLELTDSDLEGFF